MEPHQIIINGPKVPLVSPHHFTDRHVFIKGHSHLCERWGPSLEYLLNVYNVPIVEAGTHSVLVVRVIRG